MRMDSETIRKRSGEIATISRRPLWWFRFSSAKAVRPWLAIVASVSFVILAKLALARGAELALEDHLERARLALEAFDRSKMNEEFENALNIAGDSPSKKARVYYEWGSAQLTMAGYRAQAANKFRKALELDPSMDDARYSLRLIGSVGDQDPASRADH